MQLRSSPLRENLTQTQLAQLDESQLLDSDSWELTLTKCTELWPKRERYLRSKDVVDREDTVHCACGFKDAEGEMVIIANQPISNLLIWTRFDAIAAIPYSTNIAMVLRAKR